MMGCNPPRIFRVKWDNIIFTLLFIFYLAGLCRLVASDPNPTETSTDSSDSSEPTETSTDESEQEIMTSTTTTTRTTPAFDPQSTINLVLIYEKKELLEDVEEALKDIKKHLSLSESSDKTANKLKVVSRFQAAELQTSPVKLITKLCELMDTLTSSAETKPDVILDLTQTGISSEAVKVITKSLKIPTISTSVGEERDVREWRDLTQKQGKYLVRISPPTDMADQMVRSLVQLQNMTNAVVFFDNTFDMYPKYKSLMRDLPTRHKLLFLGTDRNRWSDFQKRLRTLASHGRYSNFFILATPEVISEVIYKVLQMSGAIYGSFNSKWFSWYALTLEDRKVDCKSLPGKDISLVFASPSNAKSNLKKESHGRNLENQFYYDLTFDTIMAVRKLKMEKRWPYEELGQIRCREFNASKEYPEVNLDLVSFFKAKQSQGSDSSGSGPRGSYHMIRNGQHHSEFSLDVKRVWKEKGSEGDCKESTLGVWKSGFGGKELIKFSKGTDLSFHVSNKVYRVVTVLRPPFVYWREGCSMEGEMKPGGEHCFEGYSIDVLNSLAKNLNFSYTIYNVASFGYLHPNPDKGWNGVIRELIDKRADMAVGPLTRMPEREEVVDFTWRSYYPMVGFTFAMRKTHIPSSVFSFMSVLEKDVWWCILGAYFFTTLLLWAFDRWSPNSYQNNIDTYVDDGEELPRIFTIKESLWFCFASMTPQGGGEAPKGLSGRLVASTWWLFSFIIIASYTANMAAFLTISRLAKPILSMEDLITQHRVQYSPVKDSSAYVYYDRLTNVEQLFYERWRDMSLDDSLSDFNRSLLAVWTYPISDKYTKMWQAFVESNIPTTMEEAVNRINQRNGSFIDEDAPKFALIGEETDLKYLTLTECDVKTVGQSFSHRSYAIAVQKGSPLKYDLDNELDNMAKRREIEYYYNKWWTVGVNPHLKNCRREYGHDDGIDFYNLSGIFLVTGCGLVCGFLWMFVEYAYYLWINRTKVLKPTLGSMDIDDDGVSGVSEVSDDKSQSKSKSKAVAKSMNPIRRIFARDKTEPPQETDFHTDFSAQY